MTRAEKMILMGLISEILKVKCFRATRKVAININSSLRTLVTAAAGNP